jgi:hypothetical protein
VGTGNSAWKFIKKRSVTKFTNLLMTPVEALKQLDEARAYDEKLAGGF